MPETVTKNGNRRYATEVIDAICELMAAHEATWRYGASLDGAKAMREKAIEVLTKALAH